jgi:hypothetical protein
VIYQALNYRRRAGRRREDLNPFGELALDLGDGRDGPEDHAIAREHCEQLGGWIAQLDDELKAVLVPHVCDGMSLGEIAETQGITEKMAEHRLASARSVLHARMARWQAEPPRSGRKAVHRLLLPLWQFDARTWFKTRLWPAAREIGLPTLGVVIGGLVLSDGATDPSPFRPALCFSYPVSVAVTRTVLGTMQVEAAGANEVVKSIRATLAASSGARAAPDLEASLILRASSLIETGSPEAIVEASKLLNEHLKKYKNGHLAAQREKLRREIRSARHVSTTAGARAVAP